MSRGDPSVHPDLIPADGLRSHNITWLLPPFLFLKKIKTRLPKVSNEIMNTRGNTSIAVHLEAEVSGPLFFKTRMSRKCRSIKSKRSAVSAGLMSRGRAGV